VDLKNCKKCGSLFSPDHGENICQVCRNEEEEKYQKVKEYLWDFPNATVEEVHEETGVEKELIIKFVKEGRLLADGLNVDLLLECERCGTQIESGRFCQSCKDELVSGLSESDRSKKKKKEKKDKSSGGKDQKMYTEDRIKRRKKKDK